MHPLGMTQQWSLALLLLRPSREKPSPTGAVSRAAAGSQPRWGEEGGSQEEGLLQTCWGTSGSPLDCSASPPSSEGRVDPGSTAKRQPRPPHWADRGSEAKRGKGTPWGTTALRPGAPRSSPILSALGTPAGRGFSEEGAIITPLFRRGTRGRVQSPPPPPHTQLGKM